MDRRIRERARQFARQCDTLDFDNMDCPCSVADVKKRSRQRDYCLLLSLCGMMVCNQLNMGLGQAVCHGAMHAVMNDISRQRCNVVV